MYWCYGVAACYAALLKDFVMQSTLSLVRSCNETRPKTQSEAYRFFGLVLKFSITTHKG
jgi:hypothetical protein